jgi:hypothetical protein
MQLSHRTASASLAASVSVEAGGRGRGSSLSALAGESDAFHPVPQGCHLAAIPGEHQVRLELAGTTASCAAHGMAAAMQRWSALTIRLPLSRPGDRGAAIEAAQ